MAAVVRQQLEDTSDKLRLAFSDLQSVHGQVSALIAGANCYSLSEAAAQVQKAAKMAKTRAARVLRTAKAAEVAASKAAEIVAEAQAAKAEPSEAAARPAQTARAAADAEAAAAALEAAMAPSVPVKITRHPSRDGGSSNGGVKQSGASSSGPVAHPDVKVAVKAGESNVDKIDGEEQEAPSSCAGGAEPEHGIGAEEDEGDYEEQNLEEEDQEKHEKLDDLEIWQATLGKRTLNSADQLSRRWSSRIAGTRQPSYAESPTRELSKRQRTASMPASEESEAAYPAAATSRTRQAGSSGCCNWAGCMTQASFGVGRGTKAEFCSKHAKKDMIRSFGSRCSHPVCVTHATFGVEGSKKKEFCSKHAKTGMVNVVNKRCGHPGCATIPSLGVEGSKRKEFCSKHAKTGMVNVVNKRCGHPGCATIPSFGVEGSKRKEFCWKHAKTGMVNVVNKRCGHPRLCHSR